MADHLSLEQLGIAGDISRIATLDTNPPPDRPLQTIAQHIGPVPQQPAPTPQRGGWDSIFRPPTPSARGVA